MVQNNNRREKNKVKNLYNDGYRKECGRCHQIKPHSEFYLKKKGLRSTCKTCNKYIVTKQAFSNKLLILTNINNGKFNGKCSNCENDISILPSIDFHHPYEKIKQNNWRNNRFKNWQDIMVTFEKEGVIPLCRNCHSLENADIFQNFKEIILREDLFHYSPEEIHQIINNFVKYKVKNYVKNYKFRVLEWVKKRFIVEKFYNGKCVGCKKVYIYNYLPALEFHHKFKRDEIDKIRWSKIKKYEIKKIAQLLKKQNCICLCSNCHTLLHSGQFKNVVDDIFKNKYSIKFNSYLKELLNNINEFKVQWIDIKDPLRILFKQGEAWKKYILLCYSIVLNECTNIFTPKMILSNIKISKRHLKRVIENLNKKKLIKIIRNDGDNLYLMLTIKASKKINRMIQDKKYNNYLKQFLKKRYSPARNSE